MITSKFINTKRSDLDKEIKNLWNILKQENIIDKNVTRNYNMKSVFSKIKLLSTERAKYKMYSLIVNLGFKTKPEFKKAVPNTIYDTIYELSELQEIIVKLDSIPVFSPDYKAKKGGKKGLSKTEELTSDFIKKEKNSLQIQVNALKKKLDEFNETAILDEK